MSLFEVNFLQTAYTGPCFFLIHFANLCIFLKLLAPFKLLFIYLFILAVLGLHFCARALSSCGKRGPLFIAVHGPLTIVASPAAEHRLQTRRLSSCVVVAHGPSCSAARGIFPDQGSNPRPLHQQVDSQPLRHQGSPNLCILIGEFKLFIC